MNTNKLPKDCSRRVCTIYKNRLTGHWMVDTAGTKDHPGSPEFKHGFTTFAAACEEAAEVIDHYQRMDHYRRMFGG